MATLQIDALEVGQTIIRDVKNSQGQLLIRSGTVIQERHLMLLKSWGVNEVEIMGNTAAPGTVGIPNAEVETEKGTRLASIRNSLRDKFRHNNLQSPVMAELFELCAQRKAKFTR